MTQPSKSDQTRQRILSTGRELVLQGGFGGIGLSRILSESGVPKGSFYYYFASKEAFGCAMLDDYVADYLARIDALTATPGTAGDKLATFWAAWLPTDDTQGIATRCLVVKLAAEVADLSQDMRRILDDGVTQLTSRIADLLRQGAADGSIRAQDDPVTTARTLYAQWLGAAVLAKLSSGDAPLRLALQDTARRLNPTQ
ncbi:transcriptional regulator, TetR family [Loktanella salsilacus]|jgi:TetR/AcrR family transcriptional repressor of nem operon|uniref:Transcriptional regulator, TetR family n=1 Tax=Loktanella salsilacus TaxID=195913 RepID=A0A1I4GV24_9RHOB|nr:TetR/AcrR family transcriptional regulator [Loktanella salsilacus]MBU0780681.1 TetR/AcrR family transcriptional regulator [Alphaproteobacteria bacterium]SFL33187.1 transcriptional regulator, TetR family [Loktanella salsilacus]